MEGASCCYKTARAWVGLVLPEGCLTGGYCRGYGCRVENTQGSLGTMVPRFGFGILESLIGLQ